jgi:ubiquinone/menaquinone biosynthesis C-methylase UbiE
MGVKEMSMSKEKDKGGEEEQPKNLIDLTYIRRSIDRTNPQQHLEPYVIKDQVVADLGFDTGYYTLALAECVGPDGKVYAVDLDEKRVQRLEKKVEQGGYHNIEIHATSAHDLSFINDESVDFVLANGLLCSMKDHRPSAVNEIKRILKPSGQAYLSLGSPPPLGNVDRVEWENILDGFRVHRRGGFLQKWAVVSTKQQ